MELPEKGDVSKQRRTGLRPVFSSRLLVYLAMALAVRHKHDGRGGRESKIRPIVQEILTSTRPEEERPVLDNIQVTMRRSALPLPG